jgi:two-component sensor histidine kinase
MRHTFVFVLFFVSLLVLRPRGLAQTPTHSIDSLKVLLKQSPADTNRANLLLELARRYVLKPGELASDLDTALILIRQGYSMSRYFRYAKGEGNAYLIGAQTYREKGNLPQARRFGQTAINRFAKNRNIAEQAAAHMELGNAYSNEVEELKQRIVQYERALPLFRQARQKEREAITLRMLADFYSIDHNHPKAIDLARQSLVIYQQINYPDLQGIYELLGKLCVLTGDHKKALEYGQLALKTAELRKDTTTQLCSIYNQLGLTYYYLDDFRSALGHFQQALTIARHHNEPSLVGSTGHNTANAYTKLRQYKRSIALLNNLLKTYPTMDLAYKAFMTSTILGSYYRMGQYGQAQHTCNQLMTQLTQLRKENRESEVVAIVYGPVVDFYITTHQLKLARSSLSRLEEYHNASAKKLLADNQRLRFRLDSAQGNYLSAINRFMMYKVLRDSLSIESKNKEIARLNVEFETEKKEQELKLNEANINLLKKENLVQQTSLHQQQNQRNSLIGGTVLLLALLSVTYNRYRLKQRSNQQLESKQLLIDEKNQTLQQLLEEREWMLKEIHHRVKNNLQVISSMLNSQFDFLKDPTALAAIRESQSRVQVMALIHQKLYMSDNLAQIGMQEYIHEIVDYLIESFDREHTVSSSGTIADVQLDVSLATPLGLIINEAVTNSLKYAFPQNRKGTVSIELVALADETYRLTMRDDGIGLPADFDFERSNTLGLTMIRGLSKQIKGQLEIIQDNGVHISLQFSVAKKPVKTVLKTA